MAPGVCPGFEWPLCSRHDSAALTYSGVRYTEMQKWDSSRKKGAQTYRMIPPAQPLSGTIVGGGGEG